jgi:phospholipid/cholesterol/gamma-HCH transport system permease protein
MNNIQKREEIVMIAAIRRRTLYCLEMIGDYVRLIFDVLSTVFQKPPAWQLIREQLYYMGVMSVGVVAITGFTTGVVLAAQTFYQLGEKGLGGITGVLVAKAMITELGPILTAFMVTGRVGSSMCAEIGSMKVTEQIDALRSMAVHPNRYLIAPRFIAGAVMIPLLTLFSAVMGMIGGYLISYFFFHMPTASYFNPIPLHVHVFDLAICLIKSIIFGVLLITVCCYKGMKTSGGAAGVGKATTQSVVTSYILILIFDLFLTMSLNMLYKQFKMGWDIG